MGNLQIPDRYILSDAERFAGTGVALRLVTLDDCTDRYRSWLADPQVNQYLETRHREQTLEDIRAFVTAQRADPNSYLFAIIDTRDGLHVGNLRLGNIDRHHACSDISYFIGDPSRWGKGLASAAIHCACHLAFSRLGLVRLDAGVYADNVGSARVLERVGFQREGILRHRLICKGQRQDLHYYGLLATEYVPSVARLTKEPTA